MFIVVAMMISAVPVVEVSAIIFNGNGWSFNTTTGTLTISSNEGSTVWRDVMGTGYQLTDVTTVIIQDGVTHIGAWAGNPTAPVGQTVFEGCTNLTSIIFKTITPPIFGTLIFYGTPNLTTIYVPVGSKAFYEDVSEYDVVEVGAEIISRDFFGQSITNTQLAQMVAGGEIPQNITNLILGHNQISDLASLSGLTNLRQLDLQGNTINNLEPLSGLVNLQNLCLRNNQISNLEPLSELRNLTVLWVQSNQISDITPLSNLTNLTNLELNMNQITDIEPLSGLINLTALWLNDNSIIDITYLSRLKNLTSLQLMGNQITDLAPLRGLTRLQNLFLWDNPITTAQTNELQMFLPQCSISHNAPDCSHNCECTVCTTVISFHISTVTEDGYIELHNPTQNAISTKGLYLSNDDEDFHLWQMPSIIIRAGQAIGINDVEHGLKRTQTNFDLSSGDNLRLTDGTGRVLAFVEVN